MNLFNKSVNHLCCLLCVEVFSSLVCLTTSKGLNLNLWIGAQGHIVSTIRYLVYGFILYVGSYCILAHLKQPLKDYLDHLPKVRLIRTKKREGLIRARLLGLSHARSNSIVNFVFAFEIKLNLPGYRWCIVEARYFLTWSPCLQKDPAASRSMIHATASAPGGVLFLIHASKIL